MKISFLRIAAVVAIMTSIEAERATRANSVSRQLEEMDGWTDDGWGYPEPEPEPSGKSGKGSKGSKSGCGSGKSSKSGCDEPEPESEPKPEPWGSPEWPEWPAPEWPEPEPEPSGKSGKGSKGSKSSKGSKGSKSASGEWVFVWVPLKWGATKEDAWGWSEHEPEPSGKSGKGSKGSKSGCGSGKSGKAGCPEPEPEWPEWPEWEEPEKEPESEPSGKSGKGSKGSGKGGKGSKGSKSVCGSGKSGKSGCNGQSTTLLVSYSTVEGSWAIADYIKAHKKNGKGVGIKSDTRFDHMQTVKVSNGGWYDKSIHILGYAVVSTTPDITDDEFDSLSGLRDITAVEYDGVAEAIDVKNLRGRAHDKISEDEVLMSTDQGSLGRQLQTGERTPYGIEMINVTQLWAIPPKQQVKICVIDTGYDLGHEDLPSTGVTGWDTGDRTKGLWNVDRDSHGTHCAGTIGAIGGNGVGVVGVNPDPSKFSFHIGKGLEDTGSGSETDILDAVRSCKEAGAKVISMSLASDCTGPEENCQISEAYAATMQDAYDAGILVIAAAGNSGGDNLSSPARFTTVMSVAAVTSTRERWPSSSTNSNMAIAAPGAGVLSTIPRDGGVQGSYAEFSGTSMACPHVAGVAALLISHFPECTNNQIRNAMLRSTSEPPLDSQNTPGWDKYYGWGIVNAGRAYELLKCMGCEGAGGPYPSPGETLSDQARGGMDQLSWTSITNMPDGVCQPEPEPEPSSKSGKGSKSSF